MLSKNFIEKMKLRLEEEKAEVQKRIDGYSKLDDAEVVENPDDEDIAAQATEDFLRNSVVGVHKDILDKINVALEKIEKGVYGYCEECGKTIPEIALEKDPWAEYCPVCKKNV